MAILASRRCAPLKKDTRPMRQSLAASLLGQLDPAWRITPDHKAIVRNFDFADFHEALAFANALAWMARREGHEPELELRGGRCHVRYTSRIAGGLTVNDFICAAKADLIYKGETATGSRTGAHTPRRGIERPASGATGAVRDKAEPSGPVPALNLDEASELLDRTLEERSGVIETQSGEDDEFELLDPVEQLTGTLQTQPPAEAPPATQAPPAAPATETPPAQRAAEGPAQPAKDPDEVATVVVPPPGAPAPEEEDATLILDASALPQTTPPAAEADFEKTVMISRSDLPDMPAAPPAGPSGAAAPEPGGQAEDGEDGEGDETLVMHASTFKPIRR
ncbi:MAG: hypothetical protein KatS3mg121_0842 [Gammaproteobacteria bacterium]|nr:MAG: hypothetical protein KatS3mg121_0842 [Gammaproteobacteria bacterium]